MKVIYPIRAALVALYRVHTIYVRDVRGRARFHPERKADENALAVNNVGWVSKARTRAYKEIKSTWPRSIPQPHFQLLALRVVPARLVRRWDGPTRADRERRQPLRKSTVSRINEDDANAWPTTS